MNSHSHGILSGLAIDPNNECIVTAGDDDKIMIWDIKAKKRIKQASISESQQMGVIVSQNKDKAKPEDKLSELKKRKYSLTKYFHLEEQASAI